MIFNQEVGKVIPNGTINITKETVKRKDKSSSLPIKPSGEIQGVFVFGSDVKSRSSSEPLPVKFQFCDGIYTKFNF